MNIAEYAIKKKTITLLMAIIMLVGGAISFFRLGQFEDPEFTIKSALITTLYPGATPKEVENEVTYVIEKAVQQLPELDKVTSTSRAGVSSVTVDIKPKFRRHDLPQIWNKLRNKIADIQNQLPKEAKTPIINDDYGDVYGILFSVSGDGFSFAEIKDYVDILRRELMLVDGVAKITLWGEQQEAIYVEISRVKLARSGISEKAIFSILNNQNSVTPAGYVKVGPDYIRITPTGIANSVEEISNTVISDATSGKTILLKDIATITREYKSPPFNELRFNGKPAIALGISTIPGGSVIKTGEAVRERLKQLEAEAPAGIKIDVISYQSDTVRVAILGFLRALLEAFVIVVASLIITMGLRSGILQGIILLITVGATFIVMDIIGIDLQRISLGALVIALGMLVDDAIVVNEGMLVNLERGLDPIESAKTIIKENIWPLLAATVINILAFAAIGLSPDNTGEYCQSLFLVILISLSASWIVAVTITPLLGVMFLKPAPPSHTHDHDPYASRPYQFYKSILQIALHNRGLTIISMVGLLIISIYGFTFVKRSFFPDSPRPQFLIDYWLPEGTHIDQTSADMKKIETYLLSQQEVTSVSSFMGQGAPRFILTYQPQEWNTSYGLLIVTVHDFKTIDNILPKIDKYLSENFPNAMPKLRKFQYGTATDAKVAVRVMGPSTTQLRFIADQIMDIMRQEKTAKEIRHNWRNKVKVIRPEFDAEHSQMLGISRKELNNALEQSFGGMTIGTYREKTLQIPIISRMPHQEKYDIDNLNDLQIWSDSSQKTIPIEQLIKSVETMWDNPIIRRQNLRRTIQVECNPKEGLASDLLKKIRPKVEAIKLPLGYSLEWGGEFESSSKAQAGVARALPMSYLAMALIVIILFNAIRQPLIIFMCVPLAIVGVTAGLLITGSSFGFMALLGFLSLSGMLIKNAIVLIDHIDHLIHKGHDKYHAIIDAAVGRMRPVTMTALTASLGLIPLLHDKFFGDMSVTIIFGLMFATILTLIVVPVLYAMMFHIKSPKKT
jgi:multidrug efflux pump subunit AcrB